jgi:hypothetical protein
VNAKHWPWQVAGKNPYWTWQDHIVNQWDGPAKAGRAPRTPKYRLVGFAIVLASFGTDGRDIYPSAARIAQRAGITESNAKLMRAAVIRAGLFRKTGRHRGLVAILEIDIPPEPDPWADAYRIENNTIRD